MALLICAECGNEVSSKASSCPHCGAPIKKKKGFWTYFGYGLLIIVALSLYGNFLAKQGQKTTSPPSTSTEVEKPKVTAEKYARIQPGMSYNVVVSIIGFGGEELSRNRIEGVPGVMETVETVMYQWQNPDGFGNMNAMFQNDKLVQKAQFGLE